MATPSTADINCAIVRALGLPPEHCKALDLKLRPGELPLITVNYHVHTADGLEEVVRTLRLTPLEGA
jgi:hypothetical protein